jgi:hypothetical protein
MQRKGNCNIYKIFIRRRRGHIATVSSNFLLVKGMLSGWRPKKNIGNFSKTTLYSI